MVVNNRELPEEAFLSKDATRAWALPKPTRCFRINLVIKRSNYTNKQSRIAFSGSDFTLWFAHLSHTPSASLFSHKRVSLSKLLIRNNPGPCCAWTMSKHYLDICKLLLTKTMPGSMLANKWLKDGALTCAPALPSPARIDINRKNGTKASWRLAIVLLTSHH